MCWKAEYALLIIGSTLVDYFLGHKIYEASSAYRKRLFFVVSIAGNIAFLFLFKYYNFFSDSLRELIEQFDVFVSFPAFDLLLPVGISFYTFQKLSYIIDIYRGERIPEKNVGIFSLYVAFFPQLVAGPIERSTRLLPQFYSHVTFDYDRFTSGLRLIAWGLFKKMVIADRVAMTVNVVYADPGQFSGMALVFATYLFAFQIYCDFSGYTDIAIGSARLLGISLMENFRRPYFSASIAEFWRRWHISLSTWFKDYLYIPLGGNRRGVIRNYCNLIFVFLICGLWHGANWTFIAWGFFHGAILSIEKLVAPLGKYLLPGDKSSVLTLMVHVTKVVVTFHFVCLGWIFFRANSIEDAGVILSKIFSELNVFYRYGVGAGLAMGELLSLLILMVLFLLAELLYENGVCLKEKILDLPFGARWSVYTAGILSVAIFGVFSGHSEFIYFQF